MQSGNLDQLIKLYSLVETNDRGSLKLTYSLVGKVWAHVMSQRGTEAFEAARTNAKQTIRVKIRYNNSVNVKWKINWEGQDYNIIAIDRSNRRDGELWMTCQVVGAV